MIISRHLNWDWLHLLLILPSLSRSLSLSLSKCPGCIGLFFPCFLFGKNAEFLGSGTLVGSCFTHFILWAFVNTLCCMLTQGLSLGLPGCFVSCYACGYRRALRTRYNLQVLWYLLLLSSNWRFGIFFLFHFHFFIVDLKDLCADVFSCLFRPWCYLSYLYFDATLLTSLRLLSLCPKWLIYKFVLARYEM